MKKCQLKIKIIMPTRIVMDSNKNNVSTDTVVQKTAVWAIVPAAGLGRRMGRDLPKQYISINNKTIFRLR